MSLLATRNLCAHHLLQAARWALSLALAMALRLLMLGAALVSLAFLPLTALLGGLYKRNRWAGGRACAAGGGGGSRRGLLLGREGYGSESDAAARQRGGRSFVASLPAPNLQEYRCPAAAPPLPRRRRHKSQVGQLLSLPLNDTQMRSLLGTVPSWMTDPSSVNSTERLDWLNTLLAEASGGLGLAAPPAASRCSRCSQQAAFASTLGCMPGCIQACIPACQWLVRAQHFNGKLPA